MSLDLTGQAKIMAVLSEDDLENYFRDELAPLIRFLERAAEIDNGYPDACSEGADMSKPYAKDPMDMTFNGYRLTHSVRFFATPEEDRGRKGQGQSLTVSAYANDYRLLTLSVFKGGKVFFEFEEREATRQFDRPTHVLEAMETVIQGYQGFSKNPVRAIEIAKIAAEEYNKFMATTIKPIAFQSLMKLHL